MHVDLTKPDEPDEPAADELTAAPAPAPVPTVVEKESVRLTAREELMLPLRAFGAAVAAGTPVLVCLIARAAWNGVRTASQTQATAATAAAPKKTAKKTDLRKDDEPAADSDEDEGEAGQKKEKAAPPARTAAAAAGIGDTMERLAMGALVIAVACAGGFALLTVVWTFAAPYAGWVALALIVGWCLAAAAVAPDEDGDEDEREGDTPVNDHENAAGEHGQELTPATDPALNWTRQRSATRHFVEGAVAAGAAGLLEEKGRGASVDYLLSEMREKNPLPGWDRKRMIDFLEMFDIPVRDQVSFYVLQEVNGREKKVKKNAPAVHVDDLTKELGKTPSLPPRFVADITPGQPPYLASVPPLVEAPVEAPAEAPVEGPAEGRSGVA